MYHVPCLLSAFECASTTPPGQVLVHDSLVRAQTWNINIYNTKCFWVLHAGQGKPQSTNIIEAFFATTLCA